MVFQFYMAYISVYKVFTSYLWLKSVYMKRSIIQKSIIIYGWA